MSPAAKASSAGKAEAVTREVRACFQRLRALGDALHRDLGVTAAMRAVMEALAEGGEQTVPQMARAKRVSRQHIQTLVNALRQAGLVATRPNPADRRSPLVALTRRGDATFTAMRERERSLVADLGRTLGSCDLDATLATLTALRRRLDQLAQEED